MGKWKIFIPSIDHCFLHILTTFLANCGYHANRNVRLLKQTNQTPNFRLLRRNRVFEAILHKCFFGTHFPHFWIFPIAFKRPEIVCCATLTLLPFDLTQSIIFIQYCLQFGVFKLFWWSSTFFISHIKIIIFEPLKLSFAFDRSWSPYSSTSIRCDSAALFFKWKQKINAFSKSSLCGTKFNIFNKMKKYDVVCSMTWCILNMFKMFFITTKQKKIKARSQQMFPIDTFVS